MIWPNDKLTYKNGSLFFLFNILLEILEAQLLRTISLVQTVDDSAAVQGHREPDDTNTPNNNI